MFSFWFYFVLPGCPFGIDSPKARDSFQMVLRLDSAAAKERERVQSALTTEPNAVWAVFWGSHHSNAEISRRCRLILERWRVQKEEGRLKQIVRTANGEYDQFLNSLLHSHEADLELFARASETARVFDRYLVKCSYQSLTRNVNGPLTPFHEFSTFLKQERVVLISNSFGPKTQEANLCLAKVDAANLKRAIDSVILSDGNVEIRECSRCLIIAGGDVVFGSRVDTSLVIAAGDVKLGARFGPSSQLFVIAGGKIVISGPSSKLLAVAREKHQITPTGHGSAGNLFLDGKSKPCPDLFTFRDLRADYGLEGISAEGGVTITQLTAPSPFNGLFKVGDVALSCKNKKIASVGQFRRLLRLALDTGEFEFDIERAGMKMTVRADLKKKQP